MIKVTPTINKELLLTDQKVNSILVVSVMARTSVVIEQVTGRYTINKVGNCNSKHCKSKGHHRQDEQMESNDVGRPNTEKAMLSTLVWVQNN